MSHRPSKRSHFQQHEETELNLLPMMNMFIIIISFLMTTAVFAKMAIVDVYLPQEGGGSGGPATAAVPAILTVSVLEKGFEMGGVGGGRLVPKKSDGTLDYKQLTEELVKIKGSYPNKEDAILLFPAGMPYDTVVKVMDATRETSERPKKSLFPMLSLGEVK